MSRTTETDQSTVKILEYDNVGDAIADVERALAQSGRILVRPSGRNRRFAS